MARAPRVTVEDVPHHVTHRGNRKQDVFRHDTDRRVYLRLLTTNFRENSVVIWAYALMSNHVHLVCVPRTARGLSRAVGNAHGTYALYFNSRYDLTGHLWQARFRSTAMSDAHLWNAVRYVERNPVRAGIVKRAELYPWSSAAAHSGLATDAVLAKDLPLIEAVEDWRTWLRIPDEEEDVAELRRRTRTGHPLGNEEFVRMIEQRTGRSFRERKIKGAATSVP